MRRFRVLRSVGVVLLVGMATMGAQPVALAQEATPAADEFMPEGITFAPLAFAPGLALPAPGDLDVARVSFDPGTGFPIEAGDPAFALAVIESGKLTVRQDGPLTVTRAGALAAAVSQQGAGVTSAPETEEISAGQEVTLEAGDSVLFSPHVGGEIRNDGQERTVVLVIFVGPPEAMMGEATPAP